MKNRKFSRWYLKMNHEVSVLNYLTTQDRSGFGDVERRNLRLPVSYVTTRNNMKQSFTTHLRDVDPESPATLQVKVTGDNSTVSIFPNGYGDYGSADGHGCPIFLELYEGRLRLVVFTDINEQDPVIIDLENAKEEKFISGDEDTGNIITTEFKGSNNEKYR